MFHKMSKRRNKTSLEDKIIEGNARPEFLEVFDCGIKGKGLKTRKFISSGEYVLHYTGNYLNSEPTYDDTYVYEIEWRKRVYWIDATTDHGYGRFINDEEKKPNLRVKLVVVNNLPVPVFIATRDIKPGTELSYNYGPGNSYSWRNQNLSPINRYRNQHPIYSPHVLNTGMKLSPSTKNPHCKRKLFTKENFKIRNSEELKQQVMAVGEELEDDGKDEESEEEKKDNDTVDEGKGEELEEEENDTVDDGKGEELEEEEKDNDTVDDGKSEESEEEKDNDTVDDGKGEELEEEEEKDNDAVDDWKSEESEEEKDNDTVDDGRSKESEEEKDNDTVDDGKGEESEEEEKYDDAVDDGKSEESEEEEEKYDDAVDDGKSEETVEEEEEKRSSKKHKESFDPLLMKNIVELEGNNSFRCKLCASYKSVSQIMRHLTHYHKICKKTANSIRSTCKTTKAARLSCNLCGKAVQCLSKHLRNFHNKNEGEIFLTLNTTKKMKRIESEPELSTKFLEELNRFQRYHDRSHGFKKVSKYTSSRYTNLRRLGIKFSELGHDFADFLTMPQDPEIEEALELNILDYIEKLRDSGNAADTAVVYLNDFKKFLTFIYRFNKRTPFIDFLNFQISNCKKARVGKMNLNKYGDRINLVERMKKHYTCSLSKSIRVDLLSMNSVCEDSHTEYRNYLMARLLVENIQRPGAVCNMTIDEFNDAIETGVDKVTIVVADHKTAQTNGPANIHCSGSHHKLMSKYIKYVRPSSDSPYVFLTKSGNAVSSSCAGGFLNRHFQKCEIGLDHFNLNSWRRAGNTKIQETGDPELIEAASKQLTHSREQGRTTYYNDVNAKSSSASHTHMLDVIFDEMEHDCSMGNRRSLEPFSSVGSSSPPRKKKKFHPVSPQVGALTPTQGKQKRYFRNSDRTLLREVFETDMQKGVKVSINFIKSKLSPDTCSILRQGRTVQLSDIDLSKRVFSFLKSMKFRKS